jgi:tungstate transport system ATP-binding protein
VVLDVEELQVMRGEVLVVLGPSGSGKSVMLRILNLLEEPTHGTVSFDGAEVQGLKGRERVEVARRMALIFQDPLLFRGNVEDNISYGLRVRRMHAAERARRVSEVMELVRLGGMGQKYIATLSGGEAQRAALARALAIRPEVLLLDEPFASLDAPTRRTLQEEVKRLLTDLGMTAVFVTHDQEEAARLGDRIILLKDGLIEQAGRPRDIFYEPKSEFVAGFVGFDNIYQARITCTEDGLATLEVDGHELEGVCASDSGSLVKVGIRPEDVTLARMGDAGAGSARNVLNGTVSEVEFRGPVARVTVACPFPLIALITRRSLEELELDVGVEVQARFKATAVVVIEP